MTTHEHADHGGHTMTEPMTVHRWVVFGRETVYLSHLSMFSMAEHAMQVIVAAELLDGRGEPSSAYADDRRAHPEQRLYTLDPEEFALSDALGGTPDTPFVVPADLYRNHVEQQPTHPFRLASGLNVAISRVVHAHRYAESLEPPAELEYVLLGTPDDFYLAHFISAPPDFDQIIACTANGEIATEALATGLRVTVPGRPNSLSARLQANALPVSAVLHRNGEPVPVQLTPGDEYYCNFDRDMQ